MRYKLAIIALVIATPALAIPTQTVNFTANFPANGTTSALQPSLAGTNAHDELVKFTCGGGTGSVQVRTAKTASGTLVFSWRIISDAGSKASINNIRILGFPQTVMDANWRKDGSGTVAPTSIMGASTGGQWALAFNFATPVTQGQSSRFFFLATKATSSKKGTALVACGNGMKATINILVPA